MTNRQGSVVPEFQRPQQAPGDPATPSPVTLRTDTFPGQPSQPGPYQFSNQPGIGATRVPRRRTRATYLGVGLASLLLASAVTLTPPALSGAHFPAPTPSPTRSTGLTSSHRVAANAQLSRGVVMISAVSSAGEGSGTGMVIDPDGVVVTNYHVVQGSTSLTVTVASTRTTFRATVLGHDAETDVAVLKLDGASGLESVAIDRDAVHVNDQVTVVGNAGGQGFLSAANGSVSDTDTSVTVSTDTPAGSETLESVYETTAKAQPGDSGGPLFDAQGEVTAMTSAGETIGRRSGQTVTLASYAIPIAKVTHIARQVLSGHESGSVTVGPKAYLGIMISTARDGSAVVSDVPTGTPAAKAGITAGSRLTTIGGVAVTSGADISRALALKKPHDTVIVTWTDPTGLSRQASVVLAASSIN